ncbi:hypothetical protein RT42_GL002193 [Enterococcus cecorum DSM 20682 = ATCC 43198]|nr:hypothetical protein RT42_GL002193 [Enterococcus cecorum DSM 20682 = ATCC 43198]
MRFCTLNDVVSVKQKGKVIVNYLGFCTLNDVVSVKLNV